MNRSRRNTVFGRAALGGLLVVFTILLIVSFYSSNVNHSGNEDRKDIINKNLIGDERGQNIDLESIVNDPDSFYGQVVSVRGEVDSNIDIRGMTIESAIQSGDKLLILSREALVGIGGGPGVATYRSDDNVRVSGVVRQFNQAEIEQELGIDLDDEIFSTYEGQPVIIADSIIQLKSI